MGLILLLIILVLLFGGGGFYNQIPQGHPYPKYYCKPCAAFVAVHESAPDAVDGSSTGTSVPKMWALFEAPIISLVGAAVPDRTT
jgi:hypothetical protein